MSTKKSASAKAKHNNRAVVTAQDQEEAEIKARKEARRKLSTLSPLAKAEVVNDVVEKVVSRQFTGFVDFIREQSVVGLAIGLVLGTQVKQLVDSVVNGFILPITGLFLPGKQTLNKKVWHFAVAGRPSIDIQWGSILITFISFIAVMAVVYAVFKSLKLDRLAKKKS